YLSSYCMMTSATAYLYSLSLHDALPIYMHALDFLDRLEQAGRALPFIITTGQGSESVAVELMKRGAVDYLLKDVDFLDNLPAARSEEHTSELQSRENIVCRLLLEKKNQG